MSKNREKKHADHVAERKAHVQGIVEHEAEQHEHHLVEAPKGTSRARFLFNLLLVIFLLLIFSITGPMMSTLSGDGSSTGQTYLSWTDPDGGKHTLDNVEFFTEKRRFARLEQLMPYLLLGNIEPSDDFELARFLILESLAKRSGIYVADSEVADTILEAYGSAEVYNGWLRSQRDLSASAYEGILRRGLVVRRFLKLTSTSASEVLTEDVIERWKLGAKEFNFEFVEVLAEDFKPDAEAALPADPELEEWFNKLTEFQKQPFKSERRVAADIAWYDPATGGSFETLFERYPRPEEEDPEQMAQNYYNSFSHIRFGKPEPATDEEQKEEEAEGAEDKFFSFEEVADIVSVEAPIYYSMVDWFSHIQKRITDGEEVDLATEAAELGFKFDHIDPRVRAGWIDGEEPWAGRFLFSSVGTAEAGKFARRVAVEEDALVILKVTEILQPEVPPFAEIREKVAEKWIAEQAPIIAAEKLEAIRDAFGDRPEEGEFETTATAEEFKAAVEAAGFEVQERGYDRQFPRPKGPDDRPTQAEFFIRAKSILFTLDVDTVIAAEATRDGKAAYLMRVAGQRDGDPATMTPAEAQDTLNQMRSTAQQEFFRGSYGDNEWIKRQYNVFLRTGEDEGDAEG